MGYLVLVILCICAYLIGGIHSATLISRIKGKDIKQVGSGNPGTMNMLRTFGIKMAIFTLFMDAMKGTVPALIAYFVMRNFGDLPFTASLAPAVGWLGYYMPLASKGSAALVGLCAVIGHIYPITKKFKGGKGVATTLGVFFAIQPVLAVIMLLMSIVTLCLFQYGSVTSFILVIVLTVSEIICSVHFGDNILDIVAVVVCLALVLFAHRSNIVRLIHGQERKIDLWAKFKKVFGKKTDEQQDNQYKDTEQTNQ